MLIINCPYCGPREQCEFTNGGEAHVARPSNPEKVSDKEWSEYVFFRSNPKGIYFERWVHSHGCKKWFNAVRDTSTDKVLKVYEIKDEKPSLADLGGREDLQRKRHEHLDGPPVLTDGIDRV